MEKVTLTYKGKTIGTGLYPSETLSYTDKKQPQSYTDRMQSKSNTKKQVKTYEDCTDIFKKGYVKHYKYAITSNSPLIRDKGVLEFMAYVEGVAGTKLPSDDIKNIIHQCRKSTHRMKINKFGRNFGKRKNPEKLMGDIYVK